MAEIDGAATFSKANQEPPCPPAARERRCRASSASRARPGWSCWVSRELALPLGLVDVEVCAVNAIWSGLKLCVRKELRPAARGA